MLNKSGDVSRTTLGFYNGKLLARAQAVILLERVLQIDPQPRNKSLTRVFRRFSAGLPQTAPLAEGVTPAGQKLTKTDYVARLQQYGGFYEITDVVSDTAEDPVADEAISINAQEAAETTELVRWSVAKGGSNVFYGGTGTTRATVDGTVTLSKLRLISRSLRNARAKKISKVLVGTDKVGTKPVSAAYFAYAHTSLEGDLRKVAGFQEVSDYPNGDGLPGEFGRIEDFRFFTSDLFDPWLASGASSSTLLTNGTTGTGSCDVFPVIIFAQDAMAGVPLAGKGAVDTYIVQPNKAAPGNELGQKGSFGWKMYQAAVRLNEDNIVRYEVGASQTL
jgi:N4-gp56 family major capsid protein